MTAPEQADHDRGGELTALWDTLTSLGATVYRHDSQHLPNDVIEALCRHEAHRIRAVIEGLAAGWTPPHTRHDVARQLPAVAAVTRDPSDGSRRVAPPPVPEQVERPVPIQVRHHQPRWRSIA